MASAEQTRSRVESIENPLTRFLVAVYSDELTDAEGRLRKDDCKAYLEEAFPYMKRSERTAATRMGPWSVRNATIMQLQKINETDETIVRTATAELAELAGGSDLAVAATEQINNDLHGRECFNTQPLFRLLSQAAIEHMSQQQETLTALPVAA